MKPHRCQRRELLGWLVAPIVLSGCGESATRADAPPEINYGRDVCARCGMIISEERYAAGLVAQDGTATVFDDSGELVAFVQVEGLQQRRVWVHDYDTKRWIDGEKAFFVVDATAQTPMGTGVVTFEQQAAAATYAAANQGRVLTWAEMLEQWSIDDQAA